MNSTGRLFLFPAIMAFALLHRAARADEIRVVSEEARTNFEWFSGLGFPDVKGRPYIRAATGSWTRSGDEPPQTIYSKAFLLTNGAAGFSYLDLELFQQGMVETTNGTPEHERVGFNELNLKREADELLNAYASNKIQTVTFPEFGERISKRVSTFVFAWGCWRNGFDSEAERLYQLSKTLRYGIAQVDVEHFQLTLEKEISYAMVWRAVIDFGDTSISRVELLRTFQKIVANYPHSEQKERAQQTVAMLERMITEDEAHTKMAPPNLDKLPIEGRVRELIFQLRDQHGEQYSQPGWVDIFNEWRGSTNSPAQQLVKIGYPAVPQLIAALEDPTFTRSVGYWRDFTFSHNVLTVGDCAMEILGRITGKYFYVTGHTAGYMSTDGKVSETHKLAMEWWAEFQKKGEKQLLIEGVEAGDVSSISQAKLLVERYPDAAPSALGKGIRAATNQNLRERLVQAFQNFDASAAHMFLQTELHEGNDGSRVSAAEALLHENKADVINAMIREWQNSSDYKMEDDQGWTECGRFLASVDSPDAINALEKNLRNRPLKTRMAILHNVGEGGTRYGEIRSVSERSAATADAIEALLGASLEDSGLQPGDSGPRMGRHYRDMRICDMGGYYLHQLWPERYHFDLSGSVATRDQQRLECQKILESRDLPKLRD